MNTSTFQVIIAIFLLAASWLGLVQAADENPNVVALSADL